jgi:hypothetical protein
MSEVPEKYRYVVGIIPTRDRADLAIGAIRSVLEQPDCDVKLMVSDNSTLASEIEPLQSFCRDLRDERLRYVRPPKPLSMAAHWDWAICEALASYDASHFFFLSDRMMFKAAALRELLNTAQQYPQRLISYNHDRIVDDQRPIRIEQRPYSGKLLEISTLQLSWLYSQSMFHHAFPRMVNCLVPRAVLERIKQRFGTIFASISPDFLFCCRCIECLETIVYYDKPLTFHYALDRSTGASISRGELTRASSDFRANLPVEDVRRNYATPIPELNTCANAVYNEYLIVKGETQSSRFYEIDFPKYLSVNAQEVKSVIDPVLRSQMQQMLERHGFRNGTQPRRSFQKLAQLLSAGYVWQRLGTAAKRVVTHEWSKPIWLFLAQAFGIAPPSDNRFSFVTLAEAIDYMNKYPRRPEQDEVIPARELPLAQTFTHSVVPK